MKKMYFTLILMAVFFASHGQAPGYNGLGSGLQDLTRLSKAKTRSISPENLTGKKGNGGMATLEEGSAARAARDLGQGWKVNPYLDIKSNEEFILAEITGPGAIQQIWMTLAKIPTWRFAIIKIYWDDEKQPSVEVPAGDFFCHGWNEFKQISSIPVCVNPGSALNCYWIMPFRKKCKITLTNLSEKELRIYYQINYTLTEVPDDAAYFHAQFRRSNPVPYKQDYTIVDNIKGQGHYVGTYMAWQTNSTGWWGEGEIKFYMDGDKNFPTICGTGTEDYFCGSYCFTVKDEFGKRRYDDYTTPYAGFHAILPDDNATHNSQTRFGMYRFHITDPIRFEKDLKVTMQALGWMSGGRYRPLKDDIASVAFWYQTEPHKSFPVLPSKDELEP